MKEKLEKVRSFGERIAVYSLLEDIMWLFNLRGSDIKMCPVAFSYAIVTQTNAYLFIGTKEMYQEIGKYKQLQEANVEVMPYHEFFDTAKVLLREKQIVCDFYSISVSIMNTLREIHADISPDFDKYQELKTIRNEDEMNALKRYHLIDSISLCHFFATLPLKKDVLKTDCDISDYLEEVRKTGESYEGPSFASIIANGPNGAIVHYKPSKKKPYTVDWNEGFLCDIGGAYTKGATTDVTRTVHYGTPSDKIKRAYTRTLQGHVEVQTQIFEKTKPLSSIKELAKKYMKLDNWDYQHGTGHGVGFYLNVHENPPSFHNDKMIAGNQCVTVEPGIYLKDEFGIRIENLVLIVEHDETHFEMQPLTLVPYCMKLIDKSLLEKNQIEWLNKYNERIRNEVLPSIENETVKQWILENTEKIEEN